MDTLESTRELSVHEQRRLLREVNERIYEVTQGWGLEDVPTSFHCECGCVGCADLVSLGEDEYLKVRAVGAVWIVAPRHAAMAGGAVAGEIARRAVLVETEVDEARRRSRRASYDDNRGGPQ